MEKVFRYIAKKKVDELFEKGEIFVQCFDKLNFIASESEWLIIEKVALDKHGGLGKYFDTLDMIEFKETDYYKRKIKELVEEKEILENNIKSEEEQILLKSEEIEKYKNRISIINDWIK
jgi:hypothetical protein